MSQDPRPGGPAGRAWPWLAAWCLAGNLQAETHVLVDPLATITVRHAANELATDITHAVPGEEVLVKTYEPGTKAPGVTSILVGRVDRDAMLGARSVRAEFPLLGQDLPPETFVIQSSNGNAVIGGADDRGVLYGVYAFSERVLGIDALEYWTGKQPPGRDALDLPDIAHAEPAPVFKLRGYFDNDNDHLANWQGRKLIVEFDTWKEIIDSLARLRYNYIDIHDLLGRPEYYLRDYYRQMTDYQTDLALVERVIDYAHSKGMLVQIPMMLGWEFRHITLEQVCLTEHHDLWVDTWRHYLSETPLGKGDIFVVRPRHPIYDWAYRCPEEEERGIPPGPLIDAVFSDLVRLIGEYRPGATLVTDLWQEGRNLWLAGEFTPDKAIQVLWADNGYAEFGGWPEDLRGYPFGIYLHAGVWHNQVVQDPYPGLIAKSLKEAAARGMTHNALVNGQSFKPFILNLEAAAHALWNPAGFDPETFYREWTSRYFGHAASADVVRILKLLHQAHEPVSGYRDVTKASQNLLKNLLQGVREPADPLSVKRAIALASDAAALAERAAGQVPAAGSNVFDDQVLFPASLFLKNLEWLESLMALNNALVEGRDFRASANSANDRLRELHALLLAGSRWQKWEGWYRPENFRIHTPPPRIEDLERLIAGLQ